MCIVGNSHNISKMFFEKLYKSVPDKLLISIHILLRTLKKKKKNKKTYMRIRDTKCIMDGDTLIAGPPRLYTLLPISYFYK